MYYQIFCLLLTIFFREETQKLQLALVELGEENKKLVFERGELQQQIKKQAGEIEELREMAGLVDSVATHGNINSSQGEILRSWFNLSLITVQGMNSW